jgi:hypothetical protein
MTAGVRTAVRRAQAAAFAESIRARLAEFVATDERIASDITVAATGVGGATFDEPDPSIQLVDNVTVPEAPLPPLDERRRNEAAAFAEVFGRDPTTAIDWETAAALDPHSYDAQFQGVAPKIGVVHIEPVPDAGLVRMSQWIPQRDVSSWPPPNRDFGNNRGPDPHFDPSDAKVTTYVDYSNGLVVLRQNPSIEQNRDGSPGQVRVGVPTGSVTQTADGAVRIKYDAANPFAPGVARVPPTPFEGHQVTVNGDLTIAPSQSGVQIGGTRTDYPSLEVYQDLPDGSTHTVLVDDAVSGRSWGPVFNLPFHHDVGAGGGAFAPFDTGGWNSRYDVPVPLPQTPFGPVDHPQSVPSLRIGAPVGY